MAYQKVYMNQIHSSSLLCQLSQMWRGEVLCDAFIRTGNITTKAHRVVLVAACPMLQSMDGAAIGSQLEVKLSADIKKESVMAFLQYLYEGFMMLSEDNVRDVEKISRLLQVDSVTKCCSDFHRMLKKATGRSVASDAQLRYTYADQAEFKHVRTSELLRSMQNGAEKRTSESDDSGRKRLRGSQFSSSVTDDSSFMLSSYTNPAHESQRSPYSSSHSHRPRQRQVMEDSFELVQTELDTAPGSQGRPLPGRPANTVGVSVASQINPDPDVQIVSLPETSDSTGGVMSSARPSASAFSASPANKTPSSFNFGGSLPSPSRRAGSQTMSPSVPSPVSAPKQTRPLPLPTITPKQEVISKDMPTSSPSMPSPSQSKSATSSVVSDDGRSKDSDHPEQIIIQPMSLEASQMSSSPIPDSSRQSLDAMIESDLQAMAASAAATPKDVPKSKPSATVTSRRLDDASDGSKPIVPDLSIVKIEKASARPSTSTAPGHDSDTGGLDMQVDVPPGMEDYGAVEDDDDDGSEIEMWGSFDQSGKFSDQGNSMYIQSLQESGDYGAGMGPGGSGQGPGMSRQSAGRGLQIDYANYAMKIGRSKRTLQERIVRLLCLCKSPIEYLRPLQRKIGKVKIDVIKDECLALQKAGFGFLALKNDYSNRFQRDTFFKPAPETLSLDDPWLALAQVDHATYSSNFNRLSELTNEEKSMLLSSHPHADHMNKYFTHYYQDNDRDPPKEQKMGPDETSALASRGSHFVDFQREAAPSMSSMAIREFITPKVPSAEDFNPFSSLPR